MIGLGDDVVKYVPDRRQIDVHRGEGQRRAGDAAHLGPEWPRVTGPVAEPSINPGRIERLDGVHDDRIGTPDQRGTRKLHRGHVALDQCMDAGVHRLVGARRHGQPPLDGPGIQIQSGERPLRQPSTDSRESRQITKAGSGVSTGPATGLSVDHALDHRLGVGERERPVGIADVPFRRPARSSRELAHVIGRLGPMAIVHPIQLSARALRRVERSDQPLDQRRIPGPQQEQPAGPARIGRGLGVHPQHQDHGISQQLVAKIRQTHSQGRLDLGARMLKAEGLFRIEPGSHDRQFA